MSKVGVRTHCYLIEWREGCGGDSAGSITAVTTVSFLSRAEVEAVTMG
jgi:hypothetical protein